jgi:XPG N-terminal domain
LGVNLTPIIIKTVLSLDDLRGRSFAVDANNYLYQFLSLIRMPDGTPLQDSRGNITSHLAGLMFRSTRLMHGEARTITLCTGLGNVPFFKRFGFQITEIGESLVSMKKNPWHLNAEHTASQQQRDCWRPKPEKPKRLTPSAKSLFQIAQYSA